MTVNFWTTLPFAFASYYTEQAHSGNCSAKLQLTVDTCINIRRQVTTLDNSRLPSAEAHRPAVRGGTRKSNVAPLSFNSLPLFHTLPHRYLQQEQQTNSIKNTYNTPRQPDTHCKPMHDENSA
ncbi:hypothetical protein BDB00DRAFT_232580 [Zychaea mexicana]|uniref:uncharacterized protein n=1 Tax=Zychaea mexicana TaxID=64656 RepID=UPI0022FED875|nr:uncharacterized protein BDB00DRAFT_232580 [Zychaea mexicana]KAI9499389.1 hypothetical protein BDB00DRAFT_232580 [Zychaea mexicana]